MKKILKKLHLWISIPFGLIISIICFSGAALVFETEIMEFCYPNRYFVSEVREKTVPIAELLATVTKTLPDSVSITGITIPSNPERLYEVGLSKPRRAAVYIDQYTGEVKGYTQRAAFFTFMFRTHRWLLDSMKPDGGIFWGKMIVGTATLLFAIALITGVAVWWPRTLKALKKTLRISVRKGWRRFWHGLHVAGGMYALIFLLAMSLTGLTWSFSWYRTGFYKVFGVEAQQRGQAQQQEQRRQSERTQRTEQRGQRGQAQQREEREQRGQRGQREHRAPDGRFGERTSSYANWQQVYSQLSKHNPDNKQISISAGSANVTFNRIGNRRGSDRYTFDPATGRITDSTPYQDQDKSDKIRGWIYSIHVGNWGGLITKILTFLAALIGGALPLTGYYFWIKKKFDRRKRRGAASIAASA